MRGIIETSGENIGWVDTNMNEEALRFKDMEKELDDNNDLVILSRYIQGGGDNRTFLRVFCRNFRLQNVLQSLWSLATDIIAIHFLSV